MWARTVGVLPRPMSSARQPPELGGVEERRATTGPRPGSSAARRRSPRGCVDGLVGHGLGPLEQLGAPNPLRRAPRRPNGDGSRPSPRRRISAPVSCVVLARSASAAAASFRSTRSSSTQRPRACTSGRASVASRVISAAVSSTSSNTTDQRTLLSWWAPTCGLAGRLGEQPERGARLAPGQRRHPHVEPGRFQLGAVDRHQLPGLVLAEHDLAPAQLAPGRWRTGRRRSSRTSSSASGRDGPPSLSATSMGSSCPVAPGPSTERNHAPPASGGSSCTTRRGRRGDVTDFGTTARAGGPPDRPGPPGPGSVEPSSRVVNASATAAAVSWSSAGAPAAPTGRPPR